MQSVNDPPCLNVSQMSHKLYMLGDVEARNVPDTHFVSGIPAERLDKMCFAQQNVSLFGDWLSD